MESTKGKTCIEGAMVEATQHGPLFNDISVCGDWCTKYSNTYDTCIDIAMKYAEINKIMSKYR